MGLVTVDQAPVAVVITGLACVAQGPAEPLAISAGPDSEPVLETIDLKNILGEQVPVEVDHLCGYWYEKYSMICFQVNLTLILFCSVGLNLS